MIVLLDNARDSGQARPLLPGTPGCMVLVTSRSQLTGLVTAVGACPLPVGLPTAADARVLLARRLGTQRCRAEPAAVTELVQLCACLPLALSIACAQAACQPHLPLDALVARLREARLDALGTEEETGSLRAAFSWSYRQLSAGTARMFRLLGAHPGPDISARAAASLAGTPSGRTWQDLAELTGASLLTQPRPDRFALHPLLRAYAEQAAAQTARPRRERRCSGCSTTTCTPRARPRLCSGSSGTGPPPWPSRDPASLPSGWLTARTPWPGSRPSAGCCEPWPTSPPARASSGTPGTSPVRWPLIRLAAARPARTRGPGPRRRRIRWPAA